LGSPEKLTEGTNTSQTRTQGEHGDALNRGQPPIDAQDRLEAHLAEAEEGGTDVQAGVPANPDSEGPEQIDKIDDLLTNPRPLEGRCPADVQGLIGEPDGWRTETLRAGAHAGQGWLLREYNDDGDPTGRMIRWHPGADIMAPSRTGE
jgi:hypothetical protein